MYIINIVNIEGEPIVTRSYTVEAFLNMCNGKLHTNYTIEEINKATRAFLDKYNYLEIHINPLITEEKPVNKYKQALDEIEKNIKDYCKYMCMAETMETCEGCQITEIQDIINNARSKQNEEVRQDRSGKHVI